MVSTEVVLAVLSACFCITNGAKWKLNSYSTSYGKGVVMTCEITNSFNSFLDNNGTKIVASDKYKIVANVPGEPDLVKLEISNLVESDYGIYQCNDSGETSNVTLKIKVTVQPEPESPQRLAIGYEGTIKADVYAMPKVPILWSFTGIDTGRPIAKLNAMGQMILGADKYTVTSKGALVIKKVTEDSKGTYELRVNEDDGSYSSHKVTLEVGMKPTLKVTPAKTYTKTESQDLEILCEWNNADSTTWKFTDTSGASKPITTGVKASGLTLTAVTSTNEGKYKCTASNVFGSSSVTADLTQVITPAAITSDFNSEKKVVGSAYQKICEASGRPVPIVSISKVGKTKTELVSGNGNATLEVGLLTVANAGNYTCTASNGAITVDGNPMAVNKTMNLDVLTPPAINEAMSTDSVTSAVGLGIKVKCSAEANPDPTVELKKGGTVLSADVTSTKSLVTALFTVANATKEDFGDILCVAKNAHGTANITIKAIEIVKANAPTGLRMGGEAGLQYIDLKWDAVSAADSYIVYCNATPCMHRTVETQIQISGLTRSTFYSFKVASINMAGEGNASDPVVYRTSDITKPDSVRKVSSKDVMSNTATIRWETPENVVNDKITYKVKYCVVKNGTKSDCVQRKEIRDTSIDLSKLKRATKYEVTVIAQNQNVPGMPTTFVFETKNDVPIGSTVPSGSDKKGIGSGAIAGIIIAVVIIILIVADMFCCYFNNCGFSHCCFETFCSTKGRKYVPAETKEEDAQELKPKKEPAETV